MKIDASASEDFATVAELATLWRCTQQHIYALIRRGDLPAHRIGGRVIVKRSAARVYVDQNSTTAQFGAALGTR